MRSVPYRLLLAGTAAAALAGAATAQSKIEVGVLTCTVAGGQGFIVGSTRSLDCVFQRPGADERYRGTISRLGIDIGTTQASTIAWAVLAPSAAVPTGALAGDYGGISGEATLGVGVGANALLGGSAKTIALQPLSVQAQQGLNIAAGVASLSLAPSR
jgi:hypothetical protein